jgi:hypothetical protein
LLIHGPAKRTLVRGINRDVMLLELIKQLIPSCRIRVNDHIVALHLNFSNQIT